MNSRTLAIVAVIVTAAGGLAVLRELGVELTLGADTPAWVVGAGAVVGCGVMLAAARLLRLPELGRRLLNRSRPVGAVFDELADLAEVARREGLLHAAADPRTGGHPVLGAGLHLLIRDADERLVRAALEAEEDVETQRMAGMRTAGASACRVGLGVLPLGAAIATVLLASWAGAPWGLAGTGAAVVLGVIASCFVWVCVGSKVAAELERRNAEDTLLADAALQTVLAIQCGADRRIALERLVRLLPEGMGGAEDAGSVREAA